MSNILKYFEGCIKQRVGRIEKTQKEVINSITNLLGVLNYWSNMDDSYFQNLDNIKQFDKELSECDFIHKAKMFIDSTSKSLAYISFESIDSDNIIGTAKDLINTILSKPTFSIWADVSKNATNNNVTTLGKINTLELLQVSKTLSGNSAKPEKKNSLWGKIASLSDEAKMLCKDFPKRKSYKSRQEYLDAVREYDGIIRQYIHNSSPEHKIGNYALIISSTMYLMLDFLNTLSESKKLADIDKNTFLVESESFYEEYNFLGIFDNYLKSQKFVFGNENFGNDKMLKDAYTYVKQELSIIAGGSYVSYIFGEKTLGQLTSSVLESRLSPTELFTFYVFVYLEQTLDAHFSQEKELSGEGLSNNSKADILKTIEDIIIDVYDRFEGELLEQGGSKGREIVVVKKDKLFGILEKIRSHEKYKDLQLLSSTDELKWICRFFCLCLPLIKGLTKVKLAEIMCICEKLKSSDGNPYSINTIKKELSSDSIQFPNWVKSIVRENL